MVWGLLFLCLMWPNWAGAQSMEDLRPAVVKIYSQYSRYNYHEPWQKHGQQQSNGSGCVIAGHRILTSAHVVSDSQFVQVRRAGQARKYTARIAAISHEADLAVLQVDAPDFFDGLTPLMIGSLPQLRDQVVVYGFPEGGDKLSITEGVVSRIEHSEYYHSGAYLLSCQIDASINSGNSGGPVVRQGKVVGVAFQGMTAGLYENIGYMVPAPVIQHFLKDLEDGRHHGTPDLGIAMQKLENPDLRRRYQLQPQQRGALISRIYPGSAAMGRLSVGDVVMKIDGQQIENDGTIEFRPQERTFLGYAAQKKQYGDQVVLTLWRQGRQEQVAIPLTRTINFNRLVPHLQYDQAPDYLMVGGLVFTPLSLNYLNEFAGTAPTQLLNYFSNGEMVQPGQQMVLLATVLADEYNVGYHGMKNVVVARVNGRQIYSMADLRLVFDRPPADGFFLIEDIHGFQIVLGAAQLTQATERVSRRYHVPLTTAAQRETAVE